LDPTTLETIGEETLGGTLQLNVLGAHFRYDPFLDRLVTMSAKAGLNRLPSLQINEYGRQWAVKSLQVWTFFSLRHDLHILVYQCFLEYLSKYIFMST
jgi:all-trans-8'-apo-beta-carotenal 15,15'-oxygenase